MQKSKSKKSKPKRASKALSGFRSLHSAMRGRYTTPSTEPQYQVCLALRRIINPDTPERDLWFEVLSRAILDLNRKDAYASNWFFASTDALEPICEALNTYPRVILTLMEKFKIWPPTALKTTKTKQGRDADVNADVKIIKTDSNFSYNNDYRHSHASSF